MKTDDYGTHPETEIELRQYLRELIAGPHDYETSANALRDGTVACFNYLGHMLGSSGFQAGYAALGLIGVTQGIKGPYAILKAEDNLFPQYPTPEEKARELAAGWQDWLREEAQKRLAENPEAETRTYTDEETGEEISYQPVASRVHEHWKALAGV